VTIEVKNLEAVQAFLESRVQALQGPPIVAVMREATLLVQRSARVGKAMPVDTGRLRASITPEITQMGGRTVGIVGSNVSYAPYQELGFRPHFVPAKYIGTWATRHGFKFGGLRVSGKARMFLQKAFTENISKIEALFEAFVGRLAQGD